MDQDTRSFLARRIQAVALRVANGPALKVPEGFSLVDTSELHQLIGDSIEDEEDDEPIDPQEMRIRNLNLAQLFNDGVSPAITHAGSVRRDLITEGFGEEAAEQLAGHLFIMAASSLMGVDEDYE